MAECICEFDLMMMEEVCKMVEVEELSKKMPGAINNFFNYMNEVRDIATIAKMEPTSNKKARIGTQAAGKRLQDTINMSKITQEMMDFSNCASCKHNFVLPIGPDEAKINAHNENIKRAYSKAITEYRSRSRSRGGKVPKIGKQKTRKLACLCTRMNCLGRMDGVGCFKCEWACFEFKKAKRKSRPYFDQNMECKCKICACGALIHEIEGVSQRRGEHRPWWGRNFLKMAMP